MSLLFSSALCCSAQLQNKHSATESTGDQQTVLILRSALVSLCSISLPLLVYFTALLWAYDLAFWILCPQPFRL